MSLQVSCESGVVEANRDPFFTCPICQKTTANKFVLTAHMRHHTGGWAFVCNQCDYKTNRSHDLKRHLKSRHQGALQRPYRCPVCPYRTTYAVHLQAHLSSKHPYHAQEHQTQQQQQQQYQHQQEWCRSKAAGAAVQQISVGGYLANKRDSHIFE